MYKNVQYYTQTEDHGSGDNYPMEIIKVKPLSTKIQVFKNRNQFADREFCFNDKKDFNIVWIENRAESPSPNTNKFEMEENIVCCLSSDQIYLMENYKGLKMYWISFSSGFINEAIDLKDLLFNSPLFQKPDGPNVIKINAIIKHELVEIFEKMTCEFNDFQMLSYEVLRGYLRILLIYLVRQTGTLIPNTPQRGNRIVNKFLDLVENNFITMKKVSDYAEELCVSPNYLNELIKNNSGTSASEHIKRRVILEAKHQAVFTQNSMKKIAYNLGFNDSAHFSKYFKNACGKNFTDYKNEQYHI